MAAPKELNPNAFFPPGHRRGLFQSRPWISAWLRHWGNHPALRPLVADPIETWPELFRYRQWKRGILPITTAIPTGATSPAARSIRCEYLSIAEDLANPFPEVEHYLDQALKHQWDQLLLPDVIAGTAEYAVLIDAARARGLYATEQDHDTAYAIDLRSGDFERYLANLGKNSRLRLFNRRKRLAETGTVEITNLWPDRARFFELLNGFHQERWGKPCYSGRNLAFMHDLLEGLDKAGHGIDLSVLSVSGRALSCALDINAYQRCYNLQSGYQEGAARGLSLGTLHLGYQIEKAFTANAEVYDFMAGSGKNCQYKAPLSSMSSTLKTVVLARHYRAKIINWAR